mmetsp:Transcript_14585/g.21259  ORF Transcript_14585/g.21259 Transcript_14585/m.21259 type:complete len:275 (+) Transcript_14585:31-855(+)
MEFCAGTVAGVAITLIGHPVDTLKVRMQAGYLKSLSECFKCTLKADGFKGLYQGVASPLYTVPLVNAVVFSAYAQAKYLLGGEEVFWQGVVAGSYAGLVNTVVVSPVELIRCRMQVQSNAYTTQYQYRSCWDCFLSLLRKEGVAGVYRGSVATAFREVPGYAAQFASYEWSKSHLGTSVWGHFWAGVFGGFNCWFWSYPQDIVKTKLQLQTSKESSWDGGFTKTLKQVWKEGGLRALYKGYSACFIRSTIPNGVGFLAYEYSMYMLGPFKDHCK